MMFPTVSNSHRQMPKHWNFKSMTAPQRKGSHWTKESNVIEVKGSQNKPSRWCTWRANLALDGTGNIWSLWIKKTWRPIDSLEIRFLRLWGRRWWKRFEISWWKNWLRTIPSSNRCAQTARLKWLSSKNANSGVHDSEFLCSLQDSTCQECKQLMGPSEGTASHRCDRTSRLRSQHIFALDAEPNLSWIKVEPLAHPRTTPKLK